MPSAYLQPADYVTFGAANATATQVTQASAQIDAYLQRSAGLIWAPDGAGAPCYMTGLAGEQSFTLSQALAPGSQVVATLTGATAGLRVGSVLIADMGTPAITEALVVSAASGQGVTFMNVQFAHDAGALLQNGCTVVEQRTMPENRPLTILAQAPIAAIISGVGRYGYMRRGQDTVGAIDTYNLLAVMSKFGGPPAWEMWTPQSNSFDPQSGTVWVPAGVLLAYYTEVRIHYVAGWTYATLPAAVKQACANVVNNIVATAGMPATMASLRAGDTSMQRFSPQRTGLNSLILDDDTKALLAPFRARLFA